MKRLLAWLLTLALILSCCPALRLQASAKEGVFVYTVENGEATIIGTDSPVNGDLVIPGTLGGYPVTAVSGEAFWSCQGLTSVTFPDSVITIDHNAFYDCRNLAGIWVSETHPTYSNDSCGVLFNKEKTVLLATPDVLPVCYTVPEGVTTIHDAAFNSRLWLESVILPDSVTVIGEGAFSFCPSMTTFQLGKGITQIGEMAFSFCDSLAGVYYTGAEAQWEQISIGDGNESLTNAPMHYQSKAPEAPLPPPVVEYKYELSNGNATIIGTVTPASGQITIPCTLDGYPVIAIGDDAFYSCQGLVSVVIPEGVTVLGEDAFGDCHSLAVAKLPSTLKTIGESAFFWTSNLKQLTIPEGVTSIGDGAFYWSGLTSVRIPDSVTFLGEQAFFGCHEMESVTLPNGITEISNGMFANTNLKEVVIPDSVTTLGGFHSTPMESITVPDSVTTIGNMAFSFCYSLQSAVISASVTSIEDMAFFECEKLTDVYYTGTEEQWKQILIGEQNEALIGATVHYNYILETVIPGELDGVEGVTEDDAIYLLQAILMPDLFQVEQDVDFDGNGTVNEDDAIYLLQHVLMPEFFPL